MSEKPILDAVIIQDNKKTELKGVIDFVSPTFIHFFDISSDDNGDLMMLIVKWRLSDHSHLRFSVFCAMFYPEFSLPKVLLINIKHAELHPSGAINIQKKKVNRKKFLIKTPQND